MKYVILAWVVVLTGAAPLTAADWAQRLFTAPEFDFGETPQGAVREHRFALVNPYRYPVRIKDVHTSCGCLSAIAKCAELPANGHGEIGVRWQAHAQAGEQSPTVSVEFDKPFPAVVQLALHAEVVDTVRVEPAAVFFGTVAAGEAASRAVTLTVTQPHCRVTKVTSTCPDLQATLAEIASADGDAALRRYRLQVRLSGHTRCGRLQGALAIACDPPRDVPLTIDVVGRISKSLSVSPESLTFGAIKPAESVSRRLVVRGRQPFRIQAITAEQAGFAFEFDAEAKQLVHVVQVSFTAPETAGSAFSRLAITTDPTDEYAELTAHAWVLEASQ